MFSLEFLDVDTTRVMSYNMYIMKDLEKVMTVFTLHLLLDYEGEILRGIYATRELAEAALEEELSADDIYEREEFVITEMEVIS